MRPPFLGAEKEIVVGEDVVIESNSPEEPFGVVFEDDGNTGYFYARDYSIEDSAFVDALHIYSVQGVENREKPCVVKIIWTRDFKASALLINQMPHAVFNFSRKIGYSASPYPDPNPKTGWTHCAELRQTKNLFFSDTEVIEQDGEANPDLRRAGDDLGQKGG